MVSILLSIKNPVLNEHGYCTEDERDKKVHVDEIPSAVKLPGEERGRERGKKKREIKSKMVLFCGNVTLGLNTPDQSTLVLRTATSKPKLC